jgi:acyl carrier protein
MSHDSVDDRITAFVETQFLVRLPGELGFDDDLFESGHVDSFGLIEFITYLENEFGITFTDEELMSKSFRSVARIQALVKEKLRGS